MSNDSCIELFAKNKAAIVPITFEEIVMVMTINKQFLRILVPVFYVDLYSVRRRFCVKSKDVANMIERTIIW